MSYHIYRVDINVGDKWERVEWWHYITDNGAGIVRKYDRRTSWSTANCQNLRVMPGSESRSERWLSRRLRARGRVYREVGVDCVLYGGLPCTHQPATTYRHRQRQAASRTHRTFVAINDPDTGTSRVSASWCRCGRGNSFNPSELIYARTGARIEFITVPQERLLDGCVSKAGFRWTRLWIPRS